MPQRQLGELHQFFDPDAVCRRHSTTAQDQKESSSSLVMFAFRRCNGTGLAPAGTSRTLAHNWDGRWQSYRIVESHRANRTPLTVNSFPAGVAVAAASSRRPQSRRSCAAATKSG